MENKKYVAIGIFLIIIFFIINLVNAEVEVEQGVINALDNSEWVQIIVKIYEKNDTLVSSILSELSSSEFRLKEKLLGNDGFAGNITQKGFNKLINNSYIKSIYLDKEWNILEDKINCKKDSDCRIVELTCCGCQVASLDIPIEDLLVSINKNYINQWNEDLEEKCKDIACILGMGMEQVERCNSYIPVCLENKCNIIKEDIDSKSEKVIKEDIDSKSEKEFFWSWIMIGVAIVMILSFIIIKTLKKNK